MRSCSAPRVAAGLRRVVDSHLCRIEADRAVTFVTWPPHCDLHHSIAPGHLTAGTQGSRRLNLEVAGSACGCPGMTRLGLMDLMSQLGFMQPKSSAERGCVGRTLRFLLH